MKANILTWNTEDSVKAGGFGGPSGYYTLHPDSKKDVNQLGKEAASKLAGTSQIFCLQEASRALENKWFSEDQFEWIGKMSGEAIVWDKSRFTLVTGSILSGEQYISIALFDKTSQKTVRVASIHFTGYDIAKAKAKDATELGFIGQSKICLNSALIAAKTREDYDLLLIGSDTNSEPDRYDGVHATFTRQGFEYNTPEHKTNYHQRDKEERTLDYIFSYSPEGAVKRENKPNPEGDAFKLNDVENPSDHVPVINQVDLEAPFLQRFVTFITRFGNLILTQVEKQAFVKPAGLSRRVSLINVTQKATFTPWRKARRSMISHSGATATGMALLATMVMLACIHRFSKRGLVAPIRDWMQRTPPRDLPQKAL